MDSAKAAVKDFMSKSGHHDTTVHERVAPAVTNETHHTHEHENLTTAVDKEVHQDHYHTSVQPIKDEQRLPEQHHHNLAAVDHREFHHGKDHDVKARLEQEAAKFKDSRVEGEHRHTQSVNPTVQGEHIHHHVHETIQPVVNRQTVEPHVVHTTVPIHEVHHNAAQHHSTSALPAMSMSDFKGQGGSLSGRDERNDGFEGEPRSVGSSVGNSGTTGTTGHHHHGAGTTGTGSGLAGREAARAEDDLTGRHNTTGTTGTTGSGLTGTTGRDSNLSGTNNGSNIDPNTGKKPSLINRLNPLKDTDGDGKKGFMD